MTPELLINEVECQNVACGKLIANAHQVAECEMGSGLRFTCGSDAGVTVQLLRGHGWSCMSWGLSA